jgi:hypothetical protein
MARSRTVRLCLPLAAAIAAAPAPAAADDPGFRIGSQPAWFLRGGVTTGGTVAVDDRGAYVGGELSFARLHRSRAAGVYADAYYDFGVNGTYLTAGPELGMHLRRTQRVPIGLGVDGGIALRFGGGTDVGATGRAYVSLLGALSIYARYAYFDADANDHVVQVGLALKFPLAPPLGGGL